ncbi:MAG TPA: Plug domain-containing protein, partial [Acetobacteraceae bacterium]|nr:Plug domain-containing protein [Acetobacteraceae bacterium]
MQETDTMRKARHKSWLLGSVAMGAVLSLSMGHQAAAQAVNAGSVSASGSNAAPGATAAPTQTKVFKSGQTVRVLDKQLIQQAGPTGGIARALSYAPGVNINTYGNTGSTKATITLNGVTQGWGGYSGYTQDGAVAVTFDGVPIADVVTGLWQSPTVPQNDLIQNTNVIYGPGNPVDRWYNNIAGEFQLVPL